MIDNHDEQNDDQTTDLNKKSTSTKSSGGGIFEKSFSNNKPFKKRMSENNTIDSKADVELQEQIKDILNEETISCESKSDKIMNLIFDFRKKKF